MPAKAGTDAYFKTQELKDRGIREDFNYAGYGSNFNGMYQVLKDKFNSGSDLALRLQATGNSFLFEHRLPVGRDTYWCDGYDGKGRNILGLVLMIIRDELNENPSYWNKFMDENLVPLTHDAIIDFHSEWQLLVIAARNITENYVLRQSSQLKQNIISIRSSGSTGSTRQSQVKVKYTEYTGSTGSTGYTSSLNQKRIPLQNIIDKDIYIKCQRINDTL